MSGLLPIVREATVDLRLVELVEPEGVVVSLDEAELLLSQRGVNSEWFPDETTVITKTDEFPQGEPKRSCENEALLLHRFDPDYHVVAEWPEPATEHEADQGDNPLLRSQMVREKVPERVEIIPQLVGDSAENEAVYRRVAAEIDPDLIVVRGIPPEPFRLSEWRYPHRLTAATQGAPEIPLLLDMASLSVLEKESPRVAAVSQLVGKTEMWDVKADTSTEIRESYQEYAASICELVDVGSGDE